MNQRVVAIIVGLLVLFLIVWVTVRLTRYTPLPRVEGVAAGVLLLDRWSHEVCVISASASLCVPIRR